jgi:MarR family transcriptional regulator, temperature-dependent positive regulator of motility
VSAEAIAAIRAWTRLDQAIAGFNQALAREYGVTGAQLAVLRLVHEWAGDDSVSLADMRQRLVMHPATLGQLLDRLATRGLVSIDPDPVDRRRRLVRLTGDGRRMVDSAPVAGPVRLRYVEVDPARLRHLATALDDAVTLFGLEEYLHDSPGKPGEHRAEARGGPADRRRTGRGDAARGGGAGGGPAAG